MDLDFSPKNFEEFCKANDLDEKQGKNAVLERISYLLDEFEKI